MRAVQLAPGEGKRALVLSGSPGIFSAGLDVPVLLKLDRPAMDAVWRDFYALMHALAASPIPIAIAITGHVPAGGTVLALFCDWRVAAEGDFKIGLSEVQVGLPLPPVILSVLRRLVGARQAERLAVTGLLVPPGNAAALGLVDEVVPVEQVVERAIKWCHGKERFKEPEHSGPPCVVGCLEDLRSVYMVEEGGVQCVWFYSARNAPLPIRNSVRGFKFFL